VGVAITYDQAEARKVPAEQARRRARITVAVALTGLAAVWFGPVLALRPMTDPAPLAFSTGVVVALGLYFIPVLRWARGSERLMTAGSRFLTARTWTGARTIDLRHLRRVSGLTMAGRFGPLTLLTVTDSAGVSMTFSEQGDFDAIRRALQRQAHHDGSEVKVSRVARSVLGIQPLRLKGLVAFCTGMAVPMVLILFALGVTFTIIAIAGKKPLLPDYASRKCGRRFSAKARGPSFASSLANTAAPILASIANASFSSALPATPAAPVPGAGFQASPGYPSRTAIRLRGGSETPRPSTCPVRASTAASLPCAVTTNSHRLSGDQASIWSASSVSTETEIGRSDPDTRLSR
jgi:hypothetical protein